MKKIISILIFILLLAGANAQVNFRQVLSGEDMDQVWADASSQNKSVFVDIYATWCGPCKWLDANVFSTEAAGNYMNNEFINVKLDGESEFGRGFAMKSGLSAYPSLFIFNSEQKLMNMLVGAKPWEELHPAMVSTLEYFPVLELLQNKFESGMLKEEEYPRFTKALREMGKIDYGNSVVTKYLNDFVTGSKLTENDIRVLAFYTEQKTGNWEKLVSDIGLLKRALGTDLEEFINFSVTNSIETAVDFKDITYIKELHSILPELVEGTSLNSSELETRSYIYYYHYSDLFDVMISYIDSLYENEHKGDYDWLFEAAANAVFLDPQNKPVAKKGLEWFQTCIDLHESQEYYYHLALCQYFTDSPEKTVKTLKKSLEFTKDTEIIKTTNSIIEQLKGDLEQ